MSHLSPIQHLALAAVAFSVVGCVIAWVADLAGKALDDVLDEATYGDWITIPSGTPSRLDAAAGVGNVGSGVISTPFHGPLVSAEARQDHA
jgi:hypothetical protein